MTESKGCEKGKFEGPAVYRIQVRGELDEKFSDRMGGMSITIARSDEEMSMTTLEGPLRDQAALSGVLETLYELHLPVLSVKHLGE
jgi:hypothetical protein